MVMPRRLGADASSFSWGPTNHLGHFALTGLLLEALLGRPVPCVVTVGSVAHRTGRITSGNLPAERRYQRWMTYGRAKLANLLFAFGLQRRADAVQAGLRSVAAHPGWSRTNLQFEGARMDGSRLERYAMAAGRAFAQSAEMGALPTLYAATAPEAPGGGYVGPGRLLELRGHPRLVGAAGGARDAATAARLWQLSEQLTGVRFAWKTGVRL